MRAVIGDRDFLFIALSVSTSIDTAHRGHVSQPIPAKVKKIVQIRGESLDGGVRSDQTLLFVQQKESISSPPDTFLELKISLYQKCFCGRGSVLGPAE